MTNFQTLLASGLPIGWMTILFGWQKQYLSTDQLQAFAGDQLAFSSDNHAYLVFRLYDADPTNIWEISDVLGELASAEGIAPEIAERIWNLALLKPWLAEMGSCPGYSEDAGEELLALSEFWAERGYSAYSPHTVQGRDNSLTPAEYYHADNYARILQIHRQWAEQEETILMSIEAS